MEPQYNLRICILTQLQKPLLPVGNSYVRAGVFPECVYDFFGKVGSVVQDSKRVQAASHRDLHGFEGIFYLTETPIVFEIQQSISSFSRCSCEKKSCLQNWKALQKERFFRKTMKKPWRLTPTMAF